MSTRQGVLSSRTLCAAKSFQSDDEITICKVGDDFVIRRSDETLAQLLAAFRGSIPDGVDLDEELTAERRAEATREEASH